MLDIARKKLKNESHFFVSRVQDFEHPPIFSAITSFNSTLNYLTGYGELCHSFERMFSVLSTPGVVILQFHDCIDKDYLVCKVASDGDDRLIVVATARIN